MKILWIPHTGWHIPQRAHLFCRALAERHEVHVTDWAADFSKPKDIFTKRYIGSYFYRRYRDGEVHVHGIPRISPALHISALRKLNRAIFSKCVEKIMGHYNIEVVVGSYLVPPPKAKRLIFDMYDDNPAYWIHYRANQRYAREIAETESIYIERADCIVSVSSVLLERVIRQLGGKNTPVMLIPNGIDLERFWEASGASIKKNMGLEQKRIIGYISSMGEYSGLTRLVEAFALLHDLKIALMIVGDGPLLKPAQKLVQERKIRSVYFTGKIPYRLVAGYFSALDIGVIPVDKSPFKDAASPIKLLEYTAAQKVVVSTALEEVKRMNFPNVVLVDDTPEALAEGIREALSKRFVMPESFYFYDKKNLVALYEKVLSGIN